MRNQEAAIKNVARRPGRQLEGGEQRQSILQQVGHGLAKLRVERGAHERAQQGNSQLGLVPPATADRLADVGGKTRENNSDDGRREQSVFMRGRAQVDQDQGGQRHRAARLGEELDHLRNQHGHENRHRRDTG